MQAVTPRDGSCARKNVSTKTDKGCSRCHQILSIACFGKNGIGNWNAWCNDCRTTQIRERRRGMSRAEKSEAVRRGKVWYAKHKSCPIRQARLLLCKAHKRSVEKGWAFDLDEEWVTLRVLAKKCEASGLSLDYAKLGAGQQNPYSPSIDRKDSSLGYTKENCWVVCWMYNVAKSNWKHADVLALARGLLHE